MRNRFSTKLLVQAALIAAAYAVLTIVLMPISYGGIQLRVSEALTLLPILTPAAVPGLFVGCLIANLVGSATIFDIVFGSIATGLAALLTRRLRARPVLAAAPPVLVNALIVGLVLSLTIEGFPFWFAFLTVGAGQLVACYGLGLPLLWALKKLPKRLYENFFGS